MSKKNLSSLTNEEIAAEQEKLDKERHAIREKGREFKAEIERRNMEETLVSKMARELPLTDTQNAYFQKLSEPDKKKIMTSAVKKLQARMNKLSSKKKD